jgi:hypothetical protein
MSCAVKVFSLRFEDMLLSKCAKINLRQCLHSGVCAKICICLIFLFYSMKHRLLYLWPWCVRLDDDIFVYVCIHYSTCGPGGDVLRNSVCQSTTPPVTRFPPVTYKTKSTAAPNTYPNGTDYNMHTGKFFWSIVTKKCDNEPLILMKIYSSIDSYSKW